MILARNLKESGERLSVLVDCGPNLLCDLIHIRAEHKSGALGGSSDATYVLVD